MLKVMWCGCDERLGLLEIVMVCFICSIYLIVFMCLLIKNIKGGYSVNFIENLDFYGCFFVICIWEI